MVVCADKKIVRDHSVEEIMVLSLLKCSLWNQEILPESKDIVWDQVNAIANAQGITALLFGVSSGSRKVIPAELFKTWRSRTISAVYMGDKLLRDQDELVKMLCQRGIPYAVLKGTSVARYYRKSELRLLGDIDLLVKERDLEKVDCLLKSLGYVRQNATDVIHYEYYRQDTVVEIHFALMDIPNSRGGEEVARIQARCLDNTEVANMGEYSFTVLSEPYQAFSLILHMQKHMLVSGIGLRQLVDWAVFLEQVDMNRFEEYAIPLLRQVGLFQFAKILTKTCIMYLGVSNDHRRWCDDADDCVCEELMRCIFKWGNLGQADIDGMGNLFTDRKTLGTDAKGKIHGMIGVLNRIVYRYYPDVPRIFLPVLWLFILLRYLVRSFLGRRTRKNLIKVIQNANHRSALFEKMAFFEIEE